MIIVGASTGWVAYRLRFENVLWIALAAPLGQWIGGVIAALALTLILFQPHEYAPGYINYEPRITGAFIAVLFYAISLLLGILMSTLPFFVRHRWKLRKHSQQPKPN